MISQKDALLFAKWIQEPVEFRNEVLSKDKNKRIEEYQKQAKSFFNDLKSDGIITFQNVFLDRDSILQRFDFRREQLLKLSMNIQKKLWYSKEFTGDEQFFILCMIHNYFTESIKSLFLPYVREIHKRLPKKVRKRIKLKSILTLGPVMKVLRKYKRGKYKGLFSDINIDLRNSIAHFTTSFGEENVFYKVKGKDEPISGHDFLLIVKKLVFLDAVLVHSIMKVFPTEVKQELKRRKMI